MKLVSNGTITRATEAPALEVSIPFPNDDLELNAAIAAIEQEKQYYDASEVRMNLIAPSHFHDRVFD